MLKTVKAFLEMEEAKNINSDSNFFTVIVHSGRQFTVGLVWRYGVRVSLLTAP